MLSHRDHNPLNIIFFTFLVEGKLKGTPLKTAKVIEREPVSSGAIMVHGLPDVGLVGVIAASHLIAELNMVEMAYLDSDALPPVAVLHEGLPHAPMRIFGDTNLLATISEMPIPANGVQLLMNTLLDWGLSKSPKLTVSIGGMPVQNRQDIDAPKVFGVASHANLLELLEKKGITVLREGYMVGPQAIILRYCAEKNMPAIALLAQSFYNYPDPEAAAAALKEFSNITGIKVDVTKLLEKGEEIRLRARDVMKRTQQELTKMKKTQEYDLPLYV
ncbi:MAG: proteasome assembly chaperone family protein [Candidatus Bathyarchaeia archaeon]|nr:proteasome assembly chaperone family protein [Candidatus Bathyarchaeota archaeon A05DMB-4]MDH7594686.1 PAC2 family protein [Candidatus Bathyarchaeota archaeon]